MLESSKPHQPAPLGLKIGFVLLAAGIAAWLFLHDWRWAVMGVLGLVVSAVIAGPRR